MWRYKDTLCGSLDTAQGGGAGMDSLGGAQLSQEAVVQPNMEQKRLCVSCAGAGLWLH